MTYKVIISDEAGDDLQEIYNFYYYKNPNIANNIYHTILKEVDKYLSHSPEIAAIEPILDEEHELYRSLVIYSGLFKIIFYIIDNNVIITQIWCCRRNPQDIRRV